MRLRRNFNGLSLERGCAISAENLGASLKKTHRIIQLSADSISLDGPFNTKYTYDNSGNPLWYGVIKGLPVGFTDSRDTFTLGLFPERYSNQ
jgi:hypothetical protein